MLKVIIDTNILLSGLFFKGNERKIIEKAILGEIQIILPQHVLIEAENIIKRKSTDFENREQALNVLHAITSKAEIIPIAEYKPKLAIAEQMIRDKKDSPILAAVLSTTHDYFLSGDKHFKALKLKKHISSRELLSKLEK